MNDKLDFYLLNDKFIEHLNESALALYGKIEQDPNNKSVTLEGTITSNEGQTLPPPISGSNSQINYMGVEVARYIFTGDGFRGFSETTYQELIRMLNGIVKNITFADKVSIDKLVDISFDWVRKCYIGEEKKEVFFDFLKKELNKTVDSWEILTAISHLNTSRPIQIGEVTFSRLSKDYFTGLEHKAKEIGGEQKQVARRLKAIERLYEKYHKITFAKTTVYADQDKASDIARERVAQSLEVLRLSCPTAFFPEIPSYFDIAGEDEMKITNILLSNSDGFPIESSFFDEKTRHDFVMSEEFHSINQKDQMLNKLHEILLKERDERTQLEHLILNCVTLFSQNIKARDYHLKIVFLMVTLETLLSRDSSEPIQINVGQRLAFLLNPNYNVNSLKERESIFNFFKKAYGCRSNFLHQGKDTIEPELIKELQQLVLLSIDMVVKTLHQWKTKDQMITEINKRILA